MLSDIDAATPGGFAIGLHISFSGPTFLFQTFPQGWANHYADEGLQLKDPAVLWGFTQTGYIRWNELVADDPADVIGQARDFGLAYGMTISILEKNSRTVGGFARQDREYLDVEITELHDLCKQLHHATLGLSVLSKADMAALKKMSIRLSQR